MAKISEEQIQNIVFDDLNFNKGTQYGEHLMDESLRKFGLGRSILLDKNNRIIAGNKTAQKAGELGYEKILIVETSGDTLVAVKRQDIDLNTTQGRELALADNATAQANLSWDSETIQQACEQFNFDPLDWGVDIKELQQKDNKEQQEDAQPTQAQLNVQHANTTELTLLYNELTQRGFTCSIKE